MEEIKRKRGRPKGSKNKVARKPWVNSPLHSGSKQSGETSENLAEEDQGIDPHAHGQALEKLNICAECRGSLTSSDGHFHTRMSIIYSGPEPVCCACIRRVGRTCTILQLIQE